MKLQTLLAKIHHGLIVSCQALETEPLYRPEGGIMPLMAKAAAEGGAVGIRANTVCDIRQIKAVVELPVIGIIKKEYPGTGIYITTSMAEVDALVACGVDILAVQGTSERRPDGKDAAAFLREVKAKYPNQIVMADIATMEEGLSCAAAGADLVGTTMRGYTPQTQACGETDISFIHTLAQRCPVPVIAEGHIHSPEIACAAMQAGAHAVVVGGAITRPAEITARFVGAIRAQAGENK
ncbi:MAG: N-acetylmannosamine-6-phosphate 2-epimerase [Gemmiger sp.]|nr:N-acetylmannosamine-6-phosphate 2-epimerase [Gemmiger sp.]